MPKSKIIMELADCSISAEKALKRLYVIASDLEDSDLLSWIEKELNGYSIDEPVPDYRDVGPGLLKYSGIAGTMLTNVKYTNNSLPFQAIPKEFYNDILHFYCRETIATIEQEAQSTTSFTNDLSFLIPYIKANGVITSLYREFDANSFREIKNKLLSMLLKIFVKLDKTLGNLDNLDVGNINEERVNEAKQYINKVVFVDNSIRIGDNNKLEKTSLATEG